MSDEVEAVGILWKAGLSIMGIGGLIIAFFTQRIIGDVDYLKKSDVDAKLDLANFKTEVAKDYAKDQSVQQSLARIHDRLDDGFGELRNDIKALLQKGH